VTHRPTTASHDWQEAFATLYADRTDCSRADARYIARMLHPVLGQLSPAQALHTVTSHPAFVDDLGEQLRRVNDRSRR
jgi:hypothetical protein